jgi:uncharacterized protein YbaP (TraB family)
MKKLLLATALAFAPATASAQTAPPASAPPAAAPAASAAQAPLPDADPAMWVVRDDDTTIYLFGTFHLLDARPWFNDEVKTAFDASNELVLEARLPETPAAMQPLIIQYALDADGPPLSQRLTAEQYAALNNIIAGVGAPAGAFDLLEPWFVSLTLPGLVAQQQLGLRAELGPEMMLSAAARERGMAIGELEGIEFQFRMFDGTPEEQQLAQLREALDHVDQIDDALVPMLAAWSTGNVDDLIAIMSRSTDAALFRMLFTDRNVTWAGWIQERLARPGTVFLAVGAGHLAGSDSVQSVLQARGIASARVPHVEAPAS